MKLTMDDWFGAGRGMVLKLGLGLLWVALSSVAGAQALSTTTVQGTVYLANGTPGAGTLNVSWPAFTTASGQSITAGHVMVTIAPDGFLTVNLAPNVGATPAGLYYTVVYQMSDGTTSTQYWVVPAAAQASVGQVQAQLMPAAQAVQTVSKAYVDQSIAELTESLLTASGGTLSGPLYLNGDPTQPLQASDKHYVDASITNLNAASLGASTTQFAGEVTGLQLGAAYQVDQFPGADFGAKLQACINGVSATYGGTCDARNFTGTLQMGANLTVSTANVTVLLPCATIATANQLIVTAGTRNVALRGCTLRGASTASGSQGGTVFLYSGAVAMVQVGDPTYAADTLGFHMDNAVINTTPATNSTAQGIVAYRTQEMDIESLYLLGNSNQTGMTLDGTGNYTGGSFVDDEFSGFQTAVNAVGHQIANAATTDWMNASTFLRLHIDCPLSAGSPMNGTYGINLQQGDGNTFTGGDVEGCGTALHLGANAQNNTIVGLRNENSTNQVVADTGSSYNNWMTGGTMFTGQLTDNGTRNSFLDTFHRSFNGMNGDWYGSQQDATVTNHFRVGIGAGNERGLLNRYQTDSGYRWTMGLSDATAGEQFYQVLDELNNVYRLSVGQYNQGQSSTNNQTVINAAGTGAVVLNGSNNSGTGGVVIGSGGVSETTVATINNAGNAQFNGTLQVGGVSTFIKTPTVKNQMDTEIDTILWAGLTQSQKESLVYKDWNGNSQWYAEKDASNNWELNSAIGGLDSFKAYQSTNSGDTYVNASNASGVVRVNYEAGAGTAFKVYGGSSSSVYASFTGPTSIEFPGLAASSGHNCLQVDNSGYISNTGAACGTGSGGVTGTINSGNVGQIAYYTASGAAIGGMTAVPVTAGGTGAVTAAGGLASLGGVSLNPNGNAAQTIAGPVGVSNFTSMGPRYDVTNPQFGATGNGVTDDTAAIQAAFNACWNHGVPPYGGVVEFPGAKTYIISSTINAYDGCRIEGVDNSYIGITGPPQIRWQNGATQGTTYSISSFTAAANTSPFVYGASSPSPNYQPYIVTFTSANALAANQWVLVQGCSTANGLQMNNVVAQVASASSNSFTVVVPFTPTYLGTYSDSCTATTVNTAIAFDANSRYEEDVNNISLSNVNGVASNHALGVDLYFGSRVDTGTRITNSWIDSGLYFNYYFAAGGIDVELDKGWRSDGNAAIANLYWRVSGVDNFGMANGTISATTGSSGAYVMLDDQSCLPNSGVHFSSRNMRMEVDTPISSGLGVFTMLDCPSGIAGPEFFLDLENTYTVAQNASTAGFNFPSFVMSPANDTKLSLNVVNGSFPAGTGVNTTVPFVGLPALSRSNLTGSQGVYPALTYASSTKSTGGTGNYGAFAGLSQFMGDVNVGQLWQDGIQASDFLYSDTAYSALPNGTSLYAGQVIAPPAYWNSGSSTNGRYALDVVQQAGTTGIPNGGNTTCETTTTTQFVCTSAIDLSPGDRISVGSAINKMIQSVDATNPAGVLVNVSSAVGSILTPTVLTFSAPVLGPEMQLPTKASSSPSTLTWSQGDMAQNSGATANGVAAWVNTGAGTPGTWAAVPSGNSSGQLSLSQVTNGTQSTATVCPNGVGGALTTSGCASSAVTLASAGQIAYYTSSGTAIAGMNTVPLTAGGTGASSAAGALTSLGAQAAIPGLTTDGAGGIVVPANGTFGGNLSVGTLTPTTIGASGVTFPDSTVQNSAGAPSTVAQNGSLVSTTPNSQLQLPLNPQQFGASGNGDSSTGDDCSKIQTAIDNAWQSSVSNPKTIHLNGKHYRCKDTHYQVLLPRDFGDYSATSGGTGAQFSVTYNAGSIASCNVSGGSGYNPGSYIIGQVIDFTHQGSGGAVHAMADANGVPLPGSCVVDQPGMNYTSYTDVFVNAIPQAADGAQLSATLTNGVFTSATITSNGSTMPNGNGYGSTHYVGYPASLTCSSYPAFNETFGTSGLSTTAIAGITVYSGGSGCTYGGSSSGTVPLFQNASDVTGSTQAVNIAPENPNVLGCAIQLRPGVAIDGDGAYIESDWQTGLYNLTAGRAIFCDAYGDQVQNIALKNMTLASLAGIWLSGTTNNFVVENVSEAYAAPMSNYITGAGPGGGVFFYAAQTGPGTVFRNINNNAVGSIVVGGQWASRAGNAGTGSMGGYDATSSNVSTYSLRGGNYSGLILDNITQTPFSVNGPIYATNSYSSALDQFFEQYVWKAQNSPTTNAGAPNGTGACISTQTVSVRQVDTAFGKSGSGTQFYNCYRGVSDMLFVGIPRISNLSTAVDIRQPAIYKSHRPAIIGSMDQSRVSGLTYTTTVSAYTDPYVPTSVGKEMGYVEIPDLNPAVGTVPSMIMQNFAIPAIGTNFVAPVSITQWSTSAMSMSCLWGISGITNGSSIYSGCPTQPGGITGTAGGDLSGAYPNPTVAKVNSAPVPTSVASVGTNSSGQLVAASAIPNSMLATPSATVNGQTCTLGSSCTILAAPSGTSGGDLSGSYPSPTVSKVNGGSVPVSASLVGTNSSGQLIRISAISPPYVTYNGGDLICAHGGDTTISATAITAGSGTSVTVSSVSGEFKFPGALVGIAGATPSSLNGGPYTVTSWSGSTLNFTSLPATWVSGGTVYLYCENSTDATTSTEFTQNTYSLPSASIAAGNTWSAYFPMAVWEPASVASFHINLDYGSTTLLSTASGNVGSSLAGQVMGSQVWGLTGIGAAQLEAYVLSPVGAAQAFDEATPSVSTVTGTSVLDQQVYFGANGLGSITSASGGTITGAAAGGTCTLGAFTGGGGSGAAATVTFANSGSWTGATFAVTNTGMGFTSAPTGATLSSGTTTCSGTVSLTGSLGGEQGAAILVMGMKVTN